MWNDKELRDRIITRLWRMLPALSLVLLIVLIVALSVHIRTVSEQKEALKREALKRSKPPINTVVLELKPHVIRDILDLPAIVEPWVDLGVLAEVPGKVVEVPVKEGDRVRKGTLIARIDSRDYENELASVTADYEKAQRDLKRLEPLYREEIIPKSKLDDAVAAEKRLDAALQNARLRLERTRIRAPISGRINRLDAKEGLYLNAQDPVAQVLDIGRVKVSVGIPESDVDAVRELDEFNLEFEALGGKKTVGKKFFLSQSPDSLAHLYKLQVALDNPDAEILPGMFARVRIVKKEVRDSLSVPLYAVISRANSTFVIVERDGIAHERMVETGILEGWQVQITKGLAPSDRVVVVGHRSVSEGQEINVVRVVADPEELFK